MQFSDTTNKNGGIQLIERLCRMPDGTITSTLLKQFTAAINEAFEDIMPLLLAYNDQVRWDDINHTDAPVGRINLVANQNDYKITVDDNSLDILNITHVRIFQSSSATIYTPIERILANDERVPEILSPATSITGTPSGFLELGNRLYLDILPSYSATSGIEIIFGREQSYFADTDTTKEPGIPKPFHKLPFVIAALEWVTVNRTEDRVLIGELKERVFNMKKELQTFIDLRNPSKTIMTPRRTDFI